MYKKLIAIALTSLCAINTSCFVPNLLLQLANIGSAAWVYEKGVRPFINDEVELAGSGGSSIAGKYATQHIRDILLNGHPNGDDKELIVGVSEVGPWYKKPFWNTLCDSGSTDSKKTVVISETMTVNGEKYTLSEALRDKNSWFKARREKAMDLINRYRGIIDHEIGHCNDKASEKKERLTPVVAIGTAAAGAAAERALWGPMYIAKNSKLVRGVKHFGKSLARCALRIPGAFALYGLAVMGQYGVSRYYEYSADDQIRHENIPGSIAFFKEMKQKYPSENCNASYAKYVFPQAYELVTKYTPNYEKYFNQFCNTWLYTHPLLDKRIARLEKRLNAEAILPKISYEDRMTMLERGETKDGLSFNVYQELLEAKQQGIKRGYNPLKIKNLVEAV